MTSLQSWAMSTDALEFVYTVRRGEGWGYLVRRNLRSRTGIPYVVVLAACVTVAASVVVTGVAVLAAIAVASLVVLFLLATVLSFVRSRKFFRVEQHLRIDADGITETVDGDDDLVPWAQVHRVRRWRTGCSMAVPGGAFFVPARVYRDDDVRRRFDALVDAGLAGARRSTSASEGLPSGELGEGEGVAVGVGEPGDPVAAGGVPDPEVVLVEVVEPEEPHP